MTWGINEIEAILARYLQRDEEEEDEKNDNG
jgi:hypothetical protein